MNKSRKKILSMILLGVILIGSGLPKNAYALWENDNYKWKYIGDYGYETGWQQINGKWYYFTPETEIMKIGWFYDNQYNKWYYLNSDGDMDFSKTTTEYPLELQNISKNIKQCINEEVTYRWTDNIDGDIFMCFMSGNSISNKQYYYHLSTGNVYEVRDGMFTNIATHEVFNYFTQEKAVEVVKDFLSKNNKYIPGVIEVEVDDGDSYLVHCYDNVGGYTTTNDWYYVNKTTREVKAMI